MNRNMLHAVHIIAAAISLAGGIDITLGAIDGGLPDGGLPASGSSIKSGPCDGSRTTEWVGCRTAFATALFGEEVTLRAPDYTIPRPDYTMSGIPGPGAGTGVGHVSTVQ